MPWEIKAGKIRISTTSRQIRQKTKKMKQTEKNKNILTYKIKARLLFLAK